MGIRIGSIFALIILTAVAVAQPLERVADGLVALYRLDNVLEANTVPDLAPPGGRLDLAVRGAQVRADGVHFDPAGKSDAAVSSTEAATSVISAIRASGEFTVEAWVTPASNDLTGPARILSISRGTSQRNLTLGQERNSYALRLRTSSTDQQGIPQLVAGTVTPGTLQHVVVTFDGYITWIYVDGEPILDSYGRVGPLDSWDDTMPLIIGNETSGDRSWAGSVHLVAIYAAALSPDEVRQNCGARF